MTTELNFNQAAQLFENSVAYDADGNFDAGLREEAASEVLVLERAAKNLKLALETYAADLKGHHIGKPTEDAEELARLLIDYMQDGVGHEASDVLRAALKDFANVAIHLDSGLNRLTEAQEIRTQK